MNVPRRPDLPPHPPRHERRSLPSALIVLGLIALLGAGAIGLSRLVGGPDRVRTTGTVPPRFVADLWSARDSAEVVIASRWVEGGAVDMPWTRHVLSRVLNRGAGQPDVLWRKDRGPGKP